MLVGIDRMQHATDGSVPVNDFVIVVNSRVGVHLLHLRWGDAHGHLKSLGVDKLGARLKMLRQIRSWRTRENL